MEKGCICLVSHDPGTQGAERAMLDMALLLKQAGWVVTVLIPTGRGNLASMANELGLKVLRSPFRYWMGTGSWHGRFYRFLMNIFALPHLLWLFKSGRFNIIYTHSIAVGAPAIAAMMLRFPHVWHIHEFGPYGLGEVPRSFDFGDKLTLAMIKSTKSVLVPVAHVIKSTFEPRLNGMDIRVIYQPVPFNQLPDPRDKLATNTIISNSGTKILYIGAVTETKRQEDAVRAMPKVLARHSDAVLILAGRIDTKYEKKLRALAKDIDVEQSIIYLGYLHNAPSIIAECDISINCRLVEASPRVVVESMMAGCLVIAADAGGNSEAIVSYTTGLLYKPADPDDLAEKISWAIENPRNVKNIVDEARAKSISTRSIDTYADKYVFLIEEAITTAINKRGSNND